MRVERGPIGPALEEDEPQAVVRVDGHAVLEAAGLGARASHVREAQGAQFIEGIGARGQGAGDDEHEVAPRSIRALIVAARIETTQ